MNDLMNRLADLTIETPAADDATVHADVRRGRRALRRHRALRTVTGGAMALAIAGSVVAVHAATGTSAPEAGTLSTTSHAGQAAHLQMASYTGPQQKGFTVRTVPAGFVLQGANSGVLEITRPGDTSGISTLAGKVVVTLQSSDAAFDKTGTQVSINGQAGYIHPDASGTATFLEYADGAGHDVLIQAWDDLGLTNQQLVQLADGVTVTGQAVASQG